MSLLKITYLLNSAHGNVRPGSDPFFVSHGIEISIGNKAVHQLDLGDVFACLESHVPLKRGMPKDKENIDSNLGRSVTAHFA